MVEIGDSVRGKDIYIIQTGTKYVTVFYIVLVCSVNINIPTVLSWWGPE
jgi:phosphoribosylpyrophosphate synthetase